ncbi:MAG: YjgP/YjgQ family permease [Ferruginibacter sp.]|nr:YjgP/YjgQ family permease [Ferruginibacter sp.]
MIKKLDILIIKSFLGPFIITFFIALFVLMMQILWKYIDDLVGKGLDFITIGQFLWYASASLLTLAMPIAILISSIMTFGNLGESFELVAIKSSGISLLRFMRPLMFIALLFCGITFLFANYVIPYSQLKFVTLYNDIFYKKPAFDLKEGVFFTHIPNYAIKVAKKDADGKTIRDVLIYEQSPGVQDNSIIAEYGTMTTSADKNFLEFNLHNGYRYQERGAIGDTSTEYIRLGFKEFKKLFDLSVFQKQQTPDSVFRNNYKMLSARQLGKNIDSLQKTDDSLGRKNDRFIANYLHYANVKDSFWKLKTLSTSANLKIPDSAQQLVYDKSFATLSEIKNQFQFNTAESLEREKNIRYHKIEWHRKFSFSLACMVLFFIGAPLGSIIRKGGLGMPLVVAIVFFLLFHLLNMFGEKFVKENIASPFVGMWLSIIVLTPVGIFLTYKAMHDSQLFSKEFYHRSYKRIKLLLGRKRKDYSVQI